VVEYVESGVCVGCQWRVRRGEQYMRFVGGITGGGWLRQCRWEDDYVRKKSTYLVVLCRTCREAAGSCVLVGCEVTTCQA
jgi:hypothetical protein